MAGGRFFAVFEKSKLIQKVNHINMVDKLGGVYLLFFGLDKMGWIVYLGCHFTLFLCRPLPSKETGIGTRRLDSAPFGFNVLLEDTISKTIVES